MTQKFYAGVGSRQTPKEIQDVMTEAARWLRGQNYTLRSGHAPGADQAFEEGADGEAVLYLPWPTFERGTPCKGRRVMLPEVELEERYDRLVKLGIRYAGNVKRSVKLLHGRNWCQVFGHAEGDPQVDFVLCYAEVVDGQARGGTATAVNLARRFKIPVLNLFFEEDLRRVEAKLHDAAEKP